MSRKYKFNDPEGLYFISFATVKWVDVFTRKEYKDILVESLNFCIKEKGLELFAWCIMTNHLHLIARAKDDYLLQDIIRDFKRFTSVNVLKAIRENEHDGRKKWMLDIFKQAGEENSNNNRYQFWRQDNKPIEIYSNTVIDQKMDYLHNNPVVAGIVADPEDYLYSSARNYAGLDGLIEIELI